MERWLSSRLEELEAGTLALPASLMRLRGESRPLSKSTEPSEGVAGSPGLPLEDPCWPICPESWRVITGCACVGLPAPAGGGGAWLRLGFKRWLPTGVGSWLLTLLLTLRLLPLPPMLLQDMPGKGCEVRDPGEPP
mmetsp:Transcript_56880/g.176412  ORF Transcript_56880/g.176412 Transcript_56880/m.176412 type:complete len:136 (-) Transcript_56880:148-555(-)